MKTQTVLVYSRTSVASWCSLCTVGLQKSYLVPLGRKRHCDCSTLLRLRCCNKGMGTPHCDLHTLYTSHASAGLACFLLHCRYRPRIPCRMTKIHSPQVSPHSTFRSPTSPSARNLLHGGYAPSAKSGQVPTARQVVAATTGGLFSDQGLDVIVRRR